MKKHLSLILLLAILVSGCSQEEILRNESVNGRTFTASFEQNESRTYIEEGNLLRWTKGDQISLFDGNTLNRQYKFDGETGANAGTFSIVNAPYGSGNSLTANYAVYPYASDITISDNGVITANLPATQTYADNSFGLGANTMVAVTEDTNDTFLNFKNVGGYLKLQLYSKDVTVRSITLKGNNNEKLAGVATITPIYGKDPTISMSDNATGSLTLDCGKGIKIGSTAKTATAFWIVVPPTTFKNGFEITITDVNGNETTKSTSNAISIERNVIKPMAVFEVETVETIPNKQIWYTSSDGNVVVPYKTDIFGANIVSNVYENGKGIITFDGNVTSIGYQAFSNCTSLTSITIPNSVTSIVDRAFSYCTSLTNITIPNSVTSIGDWAFFCCESLTSIIVEQGNSVYDSRDNCNAIIKTQSNKLVRGCKNTIIPNSVTSIGDGAFSGCKSLTSITIPNSVTSIGESAFYYCTSLTNITIPNSVTCIGDKAFLICTSLTSITIPNGVTSIGVSAFLECTSLTSITIPNGVTSIESSTFFACTSLTNITIPNSVTNIGESAFDTCTSLTNITIPNSVTSIGYHAFYDCTSLTRVDVKATNPPTLGFNAFSYCSSYLKIYVPSESLEAYKAADYWKDLNIVT